MNGHAGHIFDDGPKPAGKRFCINGRILDFIPDDSEIAIFGAGCFWYVQKEFNKLSGVLKTDVGYRWVDKTNYPSPTYHQISDKKTGYIEFIKIIFSPEKISYNKILETFWRIHDPTMLNGQGADIGPEYESIIFYYNDKQKSQAEKSKKEKQENCKKPIVTEIKKAGIFFKAEVYHRKYLSKGGTYSI